MGITSRSQVRRGRHLIGATNAGFGFGFAVLVLWSLLLRVARREVVVWRVKEEGLMLLLWLCVYGRGEGAAAAGRWRKPVGW